MARILKNTTGGVLFHANSGTELSPLYTTVPPSYLPLMLDAQMIAWFVGGQIIFNDGTEDFLDPADGWSRFAGEAQRLALDSDGGILSRPKFATAGWSYTMRSIEFKTSKAGSLRNQKVNPVSKVASCWNDATLNFFNEAGEVLAADENGDLPVGCVWTQLDFEPPHDIEVVGGSVLMLDDLTDDVRLSIIGAPDIPEVYGGQKHFISDLNLNYIRGRGAIKADGRTSKRMKFDAALHTSRMRVLINHAPELQTAVQILFEIFRP